VQRTVYTQPLVNNIDYTLELFTAIELTCLDKKHT